MEPPLLALTEIYFPGRTPHPQEVTIIQNLLRGDDNIEGLSVHNDKVTFHIHGTAQVDYGILDRIKKELRLKNSPEFVISAMEYARTGKKYDYRSSRQENPQEK